MQPARNNDSWLEAAAASWGFRTKENDEPQLRYLAARRQPERLSRPSDHLLLRRQMWLLSSTLSRQRNILWLCGMEGIAAA